MYVDHARVHVVRTCAYTCRRTHIPLGVSTLHVTVLITEAKNDVSIWKLPRQPISCMIHSNPIHGSTFSYYKRRSERAIGWTFAWVTANSRRLQRADDWIFTWFATNLRRLQHSSLAHFDSEPTNHRGFQPSSLFSFSSIQQRKLRSTMVGQRRDKTNVYCSRRHLK